MRQEIAQIRRYARLERQTQAVYEHLAETAEPAEREELLQLARAEGQHAEHWEAVLRKLGVDPEIDPTKPEIPLGWQAKLAIHLGRRFGLIWAMPYLEHHAGAEHAEYGRTDLATEELKAVEPSHLRRVRGLMPTWRDQAGSTLRAGIFGFSDGVVSNLALVIGVFAAGQSQGSIITAGIAGLVAGAMSMAVGEYVSVASQAEIVSAHEESSGQQEGLRAAGASFLTFALGAISPLIPFWIFPVQPAAITAVIFTGLLLYLIGASLSLLTLRPPWKSGLRQLGLGWGAAAATYVIGLILGG